MDKFKYELVMVRIEEAKYKKDIEAIARELCTKISPYALSIPDFMYTQNVTEYNKKISAEAFILLSKCFLRIMNKAYEKKVRLPEYIHSTYEKTKQWLPIVLFQINATYEQVLNAYEFESELYLTDYHYKYIQYLINVIGTNRPHFDIKITKFEVYPLINKLFFYSNCFNWDNDIIPLAVNYLKFYSKNKQSVVIDAIEQYIKNTYVIDKDSKRDAEQINKIYKELICMLKAYEETFTQQINIKLKER